MVVRAVVRDAQGKPVENLNKEDFKLFDRGKEQSITRFEVVSPAAPAANSVVFRTPGQAPPRSSPTIPEKFIAFYFDDLNTSDADMIQARDAADHYLASSLQPQDLVAIFTSGELLSDFTSDLKQLHQPLFKLQASQRSLTRARYCPDLSDYQALQITQNNAEAMGIAVDEAAHCEGGVLIPPSGMGAGGGSSGLNQSPGASTSGGGMAAVSQAEAQARTNLHQLEEVVKHTSQMHGQRTVILVSPGFLLQDEQFQLDRLIDHALRSQVVVSALDPKGLAIILRETDTSRSYIPINPATLQSTRRLDSLQEWVDIGVLADVAQGTGGEFFHNSNDLKAGFGALAGSPVYYILTFVPNDIKQDGKFHELKVTLADKEKGSWACASGQLRQAVLSKTDLQYFPVALDVKLSPGQGETHELSVNAHLDATPLHFHKEGEHNLKTVTFIFAVFDQQNTLLNAQQRRAKVNVVDAELPNLLKAGVNVNATFQLKSGSYRLREVVTHSEDHSLTTMSRNVEIP